MNKRIKYYITGRNAKQVLKKTFVINCHFSSLSS